MTCPPLKLVDARPPLQIALAEEIARMEGFGTPGTLPTLLHNPGSLVLAGQEGAFPHMFSCASIPADDPLGCRSMYAEFSTDEAGWAALHRDIAAKWVQTAYCIASAANQHLCNSDDAFHVWSIAYHWTTPPNEAYAKEIVRRLRKRGLLK